MSNETIRVLGAGVAGLTTAVRLGEVGRNVEVLTKELTQHTTSAVAAAFWEPYIIEPIAKAHEWSEKSFGKFSDIAKQLGSSAGIEKRTVVSAFTEEQEVPYWADIVPNFARLTREQLQARIGDHLPKSYSYGHTYDTWMVEMPKYLPFLLEQLQRYGTLKTQTIDNMADAFVDRNTVVNCTGLGSRDIEGVNDQSVYPVAGQVLKVRGRVAEDLLLAHNGHHPTYVVPRGNNTILGGTAMEHLYDRTPVKTTSDDILQRCRELVPGICNADIERELVGLRPARPSVRLESETFAPGKKLIHNYGHGGAGVTVSWGCAEDVVKLARG